MIVSYVLSPSVTYLFNNLFWTLYNHPPTVFPLSICARILAQNVSFYCSPDSVSLSKGNSIRFSLGSLPLLLDASCTVSTLETSKSGKELNV